MLPSLSKLTVSNIGAPKRSRPQQKVYSEEYVEAFMKTQLLQNQLENLWEHLRSVEAGSYEDFEERSDEDYEKTYPEYKRLGDLVASAEAKLAEVTPIDDDKIYNDKNYKFPTENYKFPDVPDDFEEEYEPTVWDEASRALSAFLEKRQPKGDLEDEWVDTGRMRLNDFESLWTAVWAGYKKALAAARKKEYGSDSESDEDERPLSQRVVNPRAKLPAPKTLKPSCKEVVSVLNTQFAGSSEGPNDPNDPNDPITKLKRLWELFQMGAITKDEWERKKKELLNSI